ncbi:putative G patch domain-containing protein 1, partial [Calycina marina]
MGWKEGQGVGPKIRRAARLDDVVKAREENVYMFAPENTRIISFVRKNDHKGLGFEGEMKLAGIAPNSGRDKPEDEDDNRTLLIAPKPKKKAARGGIGIGILNDTGSDDEDPYEIGPKISYNKIKGGDKKKKPAKLATNPDLKSKPVFISKKATLARAAYGLRKCHDGRLPLKGYHLSSVDEFSSVINSSGKYDPPKIPEGWTSSKQQTSTTQSSAYLSSADAAKLSKLNPKARASILGEAALPGKSVFDFISSAARERLANASGKTNLPQALGEIPEGYAMTPSQRKAELLAQVPKIDKVTAEAALSRGSSMPYADDEAKRARYRTYLENQAGITERLPERGPLNSRDAWLGELGEFASCAQIFRPMTGSMASRFTNASSGPQVSANAGNLGRDLSSKPTSKPEDPAEQAARLDMYGPMTRTSTDWFPTRLLCKRFNIQPPKNVQPGATEHADDAPRREVSELISRKAIEKLMMEGGADGQVWEAKEKIETIAGPVKREDVAMVDVERNEALEAPKADTSIFKAIFGDDSDDDDD